MARGTSGFDDDLIKQADFCRKVSPLYCGLLSILAELWRGPRLPRLHGLLEECWSARTFPAKYERPLLLALALHDLALATGSAHPLAPVYPSLGGDPGLLTASRILEALALLAASPEHVQLLRTGYVQTNETSRGVVWLWPLAVLSSRLPEKMRLFDLGASAGLNLVADHLTPIWADSVGKPLRLDAIPEITSRIGYDRAPLDVTDPVSLRRLRAAVWADDLSRLARLDQAAQVARALKARGEFRVEPAEMLEMPALVLAETRKTGEAAVVYHSYAADYLTNDRRAEFERFMRELILELPEGSLWLEFESARSQPGTYLASGAGPAELRVHWNVGGMLAHEILARAAPHPLTLQIDLGAVSRLLAQASIL